MALIGFETDDPANQISTPVGGGAGLFDVINQQRAARAALKQAFLDAGFTDAEAESYINAGRTLDSAKAERARTKEEAAKNLEFTTGMSGLESRLQDLAKVRGTNSALGQKERALALGGTYKEPTTGVEQTVGSEQSTLGQSLEQIGKNLAQSGMGDTFLRQRGATNASKSLIDTLTASQTARDLEAINTDGDIRGEAEKIGTTYGKKFDFSKPKKDANGNIIGWEYI